MSSSFSFKYVEAIAENAMPTDSGDPRFGFSDSSRGINFSCKNPGESATYDENVLLKFGDFHAIESQYRQALATPGFIAPGVLELQDFGFFENNALPIDVLNNEALIGEPICWGCDYADWYRREHDVDGLFSRLNSKSYVSKIVNGIVDNTVNDDAVILSAPGQEIYGHWLLDIIPRLEVLRSIDSASLRIYFNNVPEWAAYFLECFGIRRDRLRSHPAKFFRVRRALVPTSAKSGYRLGGDALKQAWARVARPARVVLPSEYIGAKIFLSRKRWTGSTRPSYDNIDEIEVIAARRGYRIVQPETLSISQQIRVMQGARIIIGEDGSALHNIIFSEEGARLGVLSLPQRSNLWHLAICHVLGHRVGYCYGEASGLSTEIFNAFVDELEQLHT